MSDNAKVLAVAAVGTVLPITTRVFESAEPILQILLTAGQIGVAAVTIMYVFRMWKNAKIKK